MIATTPAYRRVVIVEDEVTLRRIIARNLVRRGVLVAETGTADEAVRAVQAQKPDLLLLDVNLPDRSGWDVLRDLQRRGIEVPTVVISAVRVNPSRVAEFRPVAYLPKPFPLEALLRLVLGDGSVESDDGGNTQSESESVEEIDLSERLTGQREGGIRG
jgi:DNA-binding response OmpR family regulator